MPQRTPGPSLFSVNAMIMIVQTDLGDFLFWVGTLQMLYTEKHHPLFGHGSYRLRACRTRKPFLGWARASGHQLNHPNCISGGFPFHSSSGLYAHATYVALRSTFQALRAGLGEGLTVDPGEPWNDMVDYLAKKQVPIKSFRGKMSTCDN